MSRLELFARGLGYVALQAIGVYAISHGHYALAGGTGFLISLVWAQNVRAMSQSLSTQGDRTVYAIGAGVGTVIGMWAGGWLA